MRAYSSMLTEDFVYQLRTIAINAKASPLVIDQIDAIVAAPSEDEIEEAQKECRDIGEKEGREEQWNTCFDHVADHLEDDEIGLTETQIEQIKTLLMETKP